MNEYRSLTNNYSEPLVMSASGIEGLHSGYNRRQRRKPFVELLVEFGVRDGGTTVRICGKLGVEVLLVRAGFHCDL